MRLSIVEGGHVFCAPFQLTLATYVGVWVRGIVRGGSVCASFFLYIFVTDTLLSKCICVFVQFFNNSEF